jgi:phage terminase large subunit
LTYQKTMRIHPKNKKIRELWNSDKRYRVAYGGRGSGKSYGVAERAMLFALQNPGARLLCAKETQNTLSDSSLAIIKRVIHDHGLDAAFMQTKHGLSCKNGAEFIFKGLQHPDRIRSFESVTFCWVEEATHVSNEAWEILIPTIRADGAEIWITFNPDQESDPTYQLFVLTDRPDIERRLVNHDDNPLFPEALQRELEWDRAHDADKYLHIWEGQTRAFTEAQVFHGKWRIGQFEMPENAQFYLGADWGFSQDPTALLRCYIVANTLYIDHEAYGVGVDIVDTPAMFDTVPESRRWPMGADSARPETISHMANAGFRIHGVKKGKGSVEDGVAFIRSFDEVVIHERCKHTADEFKLYSYKRDRLTGDILPVLEDKHNHCIDALRYALERVMLSRGRPQVTATSRIW